VTEPTDPEPQPALPAQAGRLTRLADRLTLDPTAALLLLLVAAFLLRALWLNLPEGSLIFDETYYVNAARLLIGIQPPEGAPWHDAPLWLDPNTEHPPLGKVLIALSMGVFGDTGMGWRVPSLLAGMVALVALYGIVLALGGGRRMALLATALYALDVLSFLQGRIGTLDMMLVAPLLVGMWLALKQRWLLAGAVFGVAFLVKTPAVYGLGAAVLWWLLGLAILWRHERRPGLRDLLPGFTLVGAFAAVSLVGLWLLDLRTTTYTSPFDHLGRMLGYGFALQQQYSPDSIASSPFDWLVNGGQIDYLKVAVNLMVGEAVVGSTPSVWFRALINPVLIGTASIAILYGVWLAWTRPDGVARWSLVWLVTGWVPYVVLSVVANRIEYLYYALPLIPALAAITAAWLVRSRLPRLVVLGYVALNTVAFAAWFPFRQVP
jgi:4-amino-4-deoxy-L-arabinose transferase-like glycosyltransferase